MDEWKIGRRGSLGLAAALTVPGVAQAQRQQHLRIAMTASDIPTTTGMPNNGAEGMRFVGYPVFEPLVDWDLLNPADRRVGFRPGVGDRMGGG
jgi:peptide/nickel transport system substrate-binding protein